MSKIEVKYDGDNPSACMGTLTIKVDGEQIYKEQYRCYSTGSVTADKDWNFDIIQDAVRDVLSCVNVCCGGCI